MAYPRRPDSTCEQCQESFHGANREQRYCSKACFDASRAAAIAARTEKRCPTCGQTKALDLFGRASRRADGRQSQCKACGVLARRTTQRNSDLLRRFGLTAEQHDQMLADQQGACKICGATQAEGRWGRFHTDHDHACCPGATSCGECVRGLLCGNCNTGLGMFGDDPDRLLAAAVYLLRAADVDRVG